MANRYEEMAAAIERVIMAVMIMLAAVGVVVGLANGRVMMSLFYAGATVYLTQLLIKDFRKIKE